jgi:methionyl-tRNA formyltransferase
MDAGPILSQTKYNLNGDEKCTELLDTLFTLGTENLLTVLPHVFDKTVKNVEQDESMATYAPKLNVSHS